jgi:ubiquinone/menaquinone biosynthesis C-methylase UbiE
MAQPRDIGATDYNGPLHTRYHAARRLPEEAMRLWADTVRACADGKPVRTVVDIGSGTGRFSVMLAEALQANVVGVEPSDKMRAVAERENSHARVRYVAGSGEHIPLEDNSCDMAWISMVLHHMTSLSHAAREIRRVLKSDGKLLIRNSYKDRIRHVPFYEFFPAGYEVDNARLPDLTQVQETFRANGFRVDLFEQLTQATDRSFGEHVERMRMRGLSTFEYLSDEQFQEGMRRMEKAARTRDPSQPVTEPIDFMVLSCKAAGEGKSP